MTQVAQVAEKNDHHPNWSNLYSSVNVKLTTDDKHCLSSFDVELAKAMDELYKPYSIEYVSIVRRRKRNRRLLRGDVESTSRSKDNLPAVPKPLSLDLDWGKNHSHRQSSSNIIENMDGKAKSVRWDHMRVRKG